MDREGESNHESDDRRAALKELREYMNLKTGTEVKLGDAIAAVEPGCETPAYLKGI